MVTKVYDTDFSSSFYSHHSGSVYITGITYEFGSYADTTGSDVMTLTGANFVAGAKVYINNVEVPVVSVVSSTSITFPSPAKPAGTYIINVVNSDG